MYWHEDKPKKEVGVSREILDVVFSIRCRCLALDHAYDLSQALMQALPWLNNEELVGIHLIHGAESGNGWVRPDDVTNELLHLSRRTRMTLRIPERRLPDIAELTGKTLNIGGYSLEVRDFNVHELSILPTMFARYVESDPDIDEDDFMQQAAAEIQAMGVQVKKMMCGKTHSFRSPERDIFTRSLMLADLTPDEAILLQQKGLGAGRKMGYGLFIAHRGIKAVKDMDEELAGSQAAAAKV